MVIDSTAKVELQRGGHVATLLVQRPPIGLSIAIRLEELERLALELTQEARRWRDACEKDFYRVLGLARTASVDDIKKAYRRLARQVHPDLHSGAKKSEMETKFQELNAAHEVLSDPVQRARYDQQYPI